MKLNAICKELLAFLIRCTGIPFLIRNTYAKHKVTILLYHNPPTKVMEHHLKYLSKHFHFITLDSLVNAIRSKDWCSIPPKAIVITIDDGHRSNYGLLEVFKRNRVVPTIYICTKIVNTNRFFWWQVPGVAHQTLKNFTNAERLQHMEKEFGFKSTKEYSIQERQSLNLEEMMEMKDFVDFQSHGCFHPVLTTCDDQDCRQEIVESKKDIERLFGKDCKHFSFPNGDYTKRELDILKKVGYLSSRTIDLGWNNVNIDPYKLKSMGITDNASINLLSIQVFGIPAYIRRVFKGSFNGKWTTIVPNKRKN